MVIYAQITDPDTMELSTEFVTNVNISDRSGAGISSEIYKEMAARGVPDTKIMGLGSDGASVMTGLNNRTIGMMLRRNPHLVNVHCVAHRLDLCTSQAANKISALKDYQESITSLYYYFKNSPCRQEKLVSIQNILEASQLKFKVVHSVR